MEGWSRNDVRSTNIIIFKFSKCAGHSIMMLCVQRQLGFFTPSILFVWCFCRLMHTAGISLVLHTRDLRTPSLIKGVTCPVHLNSQLFRIDLLLDGRKQLRWLPLDPPFLTVGSSSVILWGLQSALRMSLWRVSVWLWCWAAEFCSHALPPSAPSSFCMLLCKFLPLSFTFQLFANSGKSRIRLFL